MNQSDNRPSYLNLIFDDSDFPVENHKAWDVLKGREFKVIANYLILHKLTSLISVPNHELKIEDLIELKSYAKMLNCPKAMSEFVASKDIEPHESSDPDKFE